MNDNDLRERFAELRAEERRTVPPFGATRRSQRRLVPRPRLVVLTLLLLVALAVTRSRETRFTAADRAVAREAAAWRPPTDFLLRTPGQEILATTPTIPDLPKGVSP